MERPEEQFEQNVSNTPEEEKDLPVPGSLTQPQRNALRELLREIKQ